MVEAVVNAANDTDQLVPMLEQVESHLGWTGEDTLADKGFRTEARFGQRWRTRFLTVGEPVRDGRERAGPYHIPRFVYDAQRGCACVREEWNWRWKGRRRVGIIGDRRRPVFALGREPVVLWRRNVADMCTGGR